jgi:hypothetical protein
MRIVLFLLGLTACATTGAADGYPGVLHDPGEWPENFMVRQSIDLQARRGDRTVDGHLDAVMQKQGDTLVIVGLGPMNARVFTLTQRGHEIDFVKGAGPDLPFSPRDILVDVHRVFFKALPRPPGSGESGILRGELDGEHVEESWENGELRSRTFIRPGTALHGAVRIEFAAGCRVDRCHPSSVIVKNEWFDYTLTITSQDYEALE